jgi:uncharacterized integral membrane protein
MRYVFLILLVALTCVLFLFKLQNPESATVQFLTASLTLPLSVLLALTYVLGMFTGGLRLALLRSWIRGAGAKAPAAP